MTAFLQTSTGDIALTNGRATLVTGVTEKAQKIVAVLSLFLGEYFLDERIGIPYFDKVLVKNPDLDVIKRLFRRAILRVTGIADVLNVTLTWDRPHRELSYTFVAIDDEGQQIAGGSGDPFIVTGDVS